MKLLDIFNNYNTYKGKIVKPYIIAEAGVNHEGEIEKAKRLIYEAQEGGANGIKFQTYKAETIASRNSPSYWDLNKEPTSSQYKLFKKYDKFWKKEFEILKKICDEIGIEFLSTPFDIESATFLNDLMDVYKISSSDITNKPFIEFICKFNKPIILSTGASYLYEIEEAVEWIENFGNPIALLHCVLNYPTKDDNANLGMIKALKEKFPDKIIGYSDHTIPKKMKMLEIATLLGSVIIEKHFTFDKSLPGNDHYHAMNMQDLKIFHKLLNQLDVIIGLQNITSLDVETTARINARRSLVAAKNISSGKIIDNSDITWKRPGFGISPKHINEVVGKKAKKKITKDEIITWNMI